MATQTTHYSLVKPAYDEQADIAVLNSDLDTIDEQMYASEKALGSTRFIQKSCVKNSSLSFTFSGICNFVIFTDGGVQALRSIIWGHCSAGGSVATNRTNATASSDLTLTNGTRLLTIANGNTSYQLNVLMIVISGANNVA